MKKRIIIIISFLLSSNFSLDIKLSGYKLILSGNPLCGQDSKYPYKKYKDRKEGLIKKKKLVAGEKLVLISAAVENIEKISADSKPSQYNLGLYLNESACLQIEVREFDVYYKMQPLQFNYKRGVNIFSWPAEIPMYYNIGLNNLYPLAKTRGADKIRIVPILLFYQKPQSTGVIYIFSLIPNKTIKELEYNIHRPEQQEYVYTAKLNDLLKDKIFQIRWNGMDSQNKPVTSGLLTLNIKATFKSSPGSEIRKEVTLNYHFYHFADLLKQKEFSKK